MAFLKFSRDKRGYEHFYLVQPSNRGKGRPRVLYWFRTPPNVKVGRSPFDPAIRRELEAQNPDVAFDWEAIIHTPIPPVIEPERWRERRRVERTLRAAEAEEADSIADATEPLPQAEIRTQVVQAIEEPEAPPAQADQVSAAAEPPATSNVTALAAPDGSVPRQGRRRRRRRGRRKAEGQNNQAAQGSEFKVQGSEVQGSSEETLEPGTLNPEPEGEV
jgi:hypothetical protein